MQSIAGLDSPVVSQRYTHVEPRIAPAGVRSAAGVAVHQAQ